MGVAVRIYFIATQSAGLKLNGEYAGVIGAFEKYVDLPDKEEVLAEVIPGGEKLPRNFFIGKSLYENPPAFLKIYLSEGQAQIYITRFESSVTGLKIRDQKQLNRLIVTLLDICGKSYASCDGETSNLYELPEEFENASLTPSAIGGLPVMLIEGASRLCVIAESGKQLYCGQANSYSIGNMLGLTVDFRGCAGYRAEREYSYNGQQLILNKNRVERKRAVSDGVMHFAFLESLLYGGDCTEYLSEELIPSASALHEYLGDFTEVTVPHQNFYDKYGDIPAAGLAYPVKQNLYEIKYFTVDIKDGKIENVKSL